MRQSFIEKNKKVAALILFLVFYLQTIIMPLHAAIIVIGYEVPANRFITTNAPIKLKKKKVETNNSYISYPKYNNKVTVPNEPKKNLKGGPIAPEASSFKPVGSDNLVNLFTGGFSYSIPLLDVGGYPVNLIYNGGISMEQEASWVGLGWNINPGTVTRNMRGVPDDFNGEDLLIQTQNVKPNRTWGGEVGVEGEVLGFKVPKMNFSLGVSVNNYIGTAIEIGAGISLNIPIFESIKTEKNCGSDTNKIGGAAQVGANMKLSSRSGLTISPSLSASLSLRDGKYNTGIGLSTSYNSRQGIKELNLGLTSSMKTIGENDPIYYKQQPGHSVNASLASSTISFARPSYIPTLRMSLQNNNYSGQLDGGAGLFGLRGGFQMQGYYSESFVPEEYKVIKKPLVGFMYSEKANSKKDAVMDFNRLNDAEVTPNTQLISAPQYSYDVFSIQGEGTGGMIRAYRGDLGFMRDNETTSKDENYSLGFDIAPVGHFGVNWNIINTPTKSGGWDDSNNTLRSTMMFKDPSSNTSFENIYFRNPGETTVSNSEFIDRIGGDNLVRFKLGGSNVNARLESTLEQFDKKTNTSKKDLNISNVNTKRDKRVQVITMLTAQEASQVGIETSIRNYSGGFDLSNNISYTNISRVLGLRKPHHISEINVTEQNGMRYNYGIPVYNLIQKDYTFSVKNLGNPATSIVEFGDNDATINSEYMQNNSKIDGYMMSMETPAYASSFLLSSLLSPDYVDLTGNGVTEDDLGTAVKFGYNKTGILKWRTPRNNNVAKTAHFNEGIKSEIRDNKANISYGEREVWYLNSIESKSMVAIFKTETRNDGRSVRGELDGRCDPYYNPSRKLTQINLYTKSEIKEKGIDNAKPIKTVNFTYSYKLCKGTPDNLNSNEGKLTLESIYFSYNGQLRNKKDQYVFNYGNTLSDNPEYAYNSTDKWGTYKSFEDNPGMPEKLSNAEYPFTGKIKSKNDLYAGAWSLKKILLPSGGQMEIEYEADDYSYVQDRRACDMFNIYGFGSSEVASTENSLYKNGLPGGDNNYVYIKIPEGLKSSNITGQKEEIATKYLQDFKQLALRLSVKMPNGFEPITVYTQYEDYGLCPGVATKDLIFLKLTSVDGKNPLVKSVLEYLIESLPGQAFPNSQPDVGGVAEFLAIIANMLGDLKNAFTNPQNQMRSGSKARNVDLSKSFIRLNNPYKIKYGGGERVKRIVVKDNWNKMTNQFTSTYGQDYDYTTTEILSGEKKTISSGVASYEPGIGSEENPFREILSFSNKLPLAPAIYGAIELPMLEGLYPAPGVGYSKVTVRSIHRKGTYGESTLRSSIGKQVTEYYTAKDFPTFSSYTPLKSVDYHRNTIGNILYKDITDRKTLSQGFLVITNDMHGKIKFQASYSESDEETPISSSYHTYRNTSKNGLNDLVDFVYSKEGGQVKAGNIGVDMELMTDVREFRVTTSGWNGQLQTDFFPAPPIPWWLFPSILVKTWTENKYRAVTCTKLINYHAIEDSVIITDKGSIVGTNTVAYDSETGAALITKTVNEFNDTLYNSNYPAYWAYSGMDLSYKNIGRTFENVNFYDGKIMNPEINQNESFESGDELYVYKQTDAIGCLPTSANIIKLWAFDKMKNNTSLTVPQKELVFMDNRGNLFTKDNVSFKIIRSGKRNLTGNIISNFTSLNSPIVDNIYLVKDASKVIASGSVDYKEKWKMDNDLFTKKTKYYDSTNCNYQLDDDCFLGQYEYAVNPYQKSLIGNFKSNKNYTFYGDRNSTLEEGSILRRDGYLTGFNNYWNFDSHNNMVPTNGNDKWKWVNEIIKINSKGQELETKNALNIYSSAQYGFLKSMPVTIANNSKLIEMFNEGFEDYNFLESINIGGFKNNCAKKHMNFSPATVVNSETVGINAHTGNAFLKILPGTTSVSVNLNPENEDFNLDFTTDVTNVMTEYGSNFTVLESVPEWCDISPTSECNSLTLAFLDCTVPGPPQPLVAQATNLSQTSKIEYFIKVQNPSSQTNNFIFTSTSSNHMHSSNQATATASTVITDLDGIFINYINSWSGSNNGINTRQICLKNGIYKVKTIYESSYIIPSGFSGPYGSINFLVYHPGLQCYKSLNTALGCEYTLPIKAYENMINPIFSPQPGKKMIISAWVREACSTTPCNKTTYEDSKIDVSFIDGNSTTFSFSPEGAIIEGWQKVSGVFTIPADATVLKLKFVNSSGQPSYWDDIRILPFNGNMKGYVYDPFSLRLIAELDENNYATFYEYDEEGQMIRLKKETSQGIKTINETRSSRQTGITEISE